MRRGSLRLRERNARRERGRSVTVCRPAASGPGARAERPPSTERAALAERAPRARPGGRRRRRPPPPAPAAEAAARHGAALGALPTTAFREARKQRPGRQAQDRQRLDAAAAAAAAAASRHLARRRPGRARSSPAALPGGRPTPASTLGCTTRFVFQRHHLFFSCDVVLTRGGAYRRRASGKQESG